MSSCWSGEERLGRGVAGSPCGSCDVEPPAGFGGVLRALVGMKDHAADVAAPCGDCGVDRGFGQLRGRVMARGGEPGHAPQAQVQHRREHRTLRGFDLFEAAAPFLVYRLGAEAAPQQALSSQWAGFWPVRPLFLGLGRAHSPWRAIDASTVLRDTAMPPRRSRAVTPGDP